MDNDFQPPVIPGTTGAASITAGSNYAATTSPFFTVSNQFLPRNLHDVIRWSKYITMQSPVTTEVIRKYATYPITEFSVDNKSDNVKEKYRDVFSSFKLKSALHDIGFDYYTVGNVFVSIYFPIHRSLVCTKCGAVHNAKTASFTTFKKYGFHGKCPACNQEGEFFRRDSKSMNVSDMNLIKWDATNLAVNNNPITGESEFYYKIPNDIKKKVQAGDKLFVNSVPWGFIEAVKNNQDFKFDSDQIFHMKNVSAGHSINGIAVPPLISLFSLVYYQATLRKANESISTDFMNPLRVVYPTAQTGNSDPVVSISMRNFVGNMTEALTKHKKDRNHVLIAPVPIGYQAISGEGKNLLVSQEIQQAEESILLSLGVSKELLSGVTNWQSSTVGLRLLQNTMQTYVAQVEILVNWIMLHVTKYLGIETSKVSLVPFKLTDDDSLRQMLLQLVQVGEASPSDLYESYGMSYEDVLEKKHKDAIAKAVHEVRTKFAVEQAVFLESRDVTDKFDKDSDYRTTLAKAQQVSQQLVNCDDMTKRKVLGELRVTDYPMYLLTTSILEDFMNQGSPMVDETEESLNSKKLKNEEEKKGNSNNEPQKSSPQKESK